VPSTAASVIEKSTARTPLWSRSVGSMKCQLSGLIRPKTTIQSTVSSSADSSVSTACQNTATRMNDLGSGLEDRTSCDKSRGSAQQQSCSSNVVSAGLAGLGSYSSSSGSEKDEDSS